MGGRLQKIREFFRFHGFKLFVIGLPAFFVAMAFQNCGNVQSNLSTGMDQLAPQSPFAGRRVRLTDKAALQKLVDKDLERFDPSKITLMIRNRCVTDWCQTAADAHESLACEIRQNIQPIEELREAIQAYSWEIEADSNEESLEQELRANSVDNECIVAVSHELSYELEQSPAYNPNDPQVAHEYYHQVLNGPEAYEYFYPAQSGVTIGIIDAGIQTSTDRHENMSGFLNVRVAPGEENSGACEEVCHWHGHFVGNIIRGRYNNSRGGHGIATAGTTWMLQVGDDQGRLTTTQMINAIQQAHYYGIEILNMSLAGNGLLDFGVQDRMLSLMNNDVLIVVSAGNDGRNLSTQPTYPAAFNFDRQITVGAASPRAVLQATTNPPYTQEELATPIQRDSYSNYSSSLVHISAPGTRIYSAMLNNTYGYRNGTSFSAPMVTAAAALVKGHLKRHGINASAQMVKALVLQGSRSVSSLNEEINGQSTPVFQNNRILDLRRLAEVTKEFVEANEAQPASIELVSSTTVINPATGQREVRITLDVRGATGDMGYELRSYTNSSFLDTSYTGSSCQIEHERQVCEITVRYNQLLADPHIYLQVTNSSGDIISDLTIPKVAINLGVKEDAQLKGEIISAVHHGSYFEVEGWACLEGFADPIQIEVIRTDRPDTVYATFQTSQQARGNYFTECNAPEITFGFRYTIPNFRFNTPLSFRARHLETGKETLLNVLRHQPGYEDESPTEHSDRLVVDSQLNLHNVNFNITNWSIREWMVTVEGTACIANSHRPPTFQLRISPDYSDPLLFLRNTPEGRAALPPSENSGQEASLQKAVEIKTISRSYSITHSETREVDDVGHRAGFGNFSDIHYSTRFTPEAGAESLAYLVSKKDMTRNPGGAITITPNQERGDGCRHPSGFSSSFDIREIFTGASGSSSLSYRADVYTEAQLLTLVDIDRLLPFLKLSSSLQLDFNSLSFSPRMFNAQLVSPFGSQITQLNLTFPDFSYWILRQLHNQFLAGSLTTEDVPITQIRGNLLTPTKNIKLMPQNQRVDVSSMTTVYQSALITKPAHIYKIMPYLFYEDGSRFGFINEDFKLQIYLTSTGRWYDVPMESSRNSLQESDDENVRLYRGIIAGDIDFPQNTDRFRIRIISNEKTKLNISAVGYYLE
jgi:subtilisin family serine protease